MNWKSLNTISSNVLKSLVLLTIIFVISGCKKESKEEVDDSSSNKLTQIMNEYRQKGCDCGDEYFPPVNKVKWNSLLEKAAKIHSDDMDKNKFFEHAGSDGSNGEDRIKRARYSPNYWGENIAHDYPNEEAVMDAWIKSPTHCKNIMNPSFTEFGVAKTGVYWTMELASPK